MEPITTSPLGTVLSRYSTIPDVMNSLPRPSTVITSLIPENQLLISMSERQDENESGSEISPKSSSTEPERRKKKPYKELTLEEKVQLIKLAEENAGMSQASIAERYAIAKSNVCRILQRKNEYLRAYESAGFAGSRKRKLKGMENIQTEPPRAEGLLAPQPQKPILEGNETLRAHMYKQHGISRMFMCRCCNWAFPDKTSLHMHIQAKDEGKNVSVPVIGKGLVPGGPELLHPSRIGHMGPLGPGQMIPPGTQLDSSAFSPLHPTVNNNTLPHSVGVAPHGQVLPAPIPMFSASSATEMPPPSDDLIARLRERLMLNSLMINQAQNGFGFTAAWINNQFSTKPNENVDPTSVPEMSLSRATDVVINVEKGDEEAGTHRRDDKETVACSSSDNEEQKYDKCEERKRRSESPAEGGSCTDGSSPSHTRICSSPLDASAHSTHPSSDIFKKDSGSPSAFHPMLKLEQPTAQYPDDVAIHVSPSDSHCTVSPSIDRSNSHCYECTIRKNRLNVCESRCQYLEWTQTQMQSELLRIRSAAMSNETVARTLELECRGLREHNEAMRRKIIECQEQALIFAQSPERCSNPQSVQMFLNSLIQATMMK